MQIAGKYVIEKQLGAGGMGVVLAARHQVLGQRVAIKCMRADAAQDPSAVARFLREARAAVSLASEHVARVLDVATLENGAPFIVMEFLAGQDLGQLLQRNGPMPCSTAVGVLLQACEAVAEAHRQGIVHRDLKPSNLFVTQDIDGRPFVKVLDFGISKLTEPVAHEAQQGLTGSGTLMGSPGYMSPEQVRSSKDVGPASDVWSLGVILYELLTGTSPFLGPTLGETLARILSEEPAPIVRLRADVPDGLAAAVSRCLERDLKRRTPDVAQLAAALLPFGPPEAKVSVERILRLSSASASDDGGSGAAPRTLTAGPGFGVPATGDRVETAPAWLRTGTPPQPTHRPNRRPVLGVAIALGLAVAGAAFLLRGRHGNPVLVISTGAARAPVAASSVAEDTGEKPTIGRQTEPESNGAPPSLSGADASASVDASPTLLSQPPPPTAVANAPLLPSTPVAASNPAPGSAIPLRAPHVRPAAPAPRLPPPPATASSAPAAPAPPYPVETDHGF